MNIGDVFFAVGIIIISSLLVFVVYDDITNPYPNILDENLEINVNEEYNISENDTKLVPSSALNNSIDMELISNTKTRYVQSSNSVKSTEKLKSGTSSVQNSNQPKDNENNNIKANSRDIKPSSISNNNNNNNKAMNKNNQINKKNNNRQVNQMPKN